MSSTSSSSEHYATRGNNLKKKDLLKKWNIKSFEYLLIIIIIISTTNIQLCSSFECPTDYWTVTRNLKLKGNVRSNDLQVVEINREKCDVEGGVLCFKLCGAKCEGVETCQASLYCDGKCTLIHNHPVYLNSDMEEGEGCYLHSKPFCKRQLCDEMKPKCGGGKEADYSSNFNSLGDEMMNRYFVDIGPGYTESSCMEYCLYNHDCIGISYLAQKENDGDASYFCFLNVYEEKFTAVFQPGFSNYALKRCLPKKGIDNPFVNWFCIA